MTHPDRLIVGISGASGVIYGIRLLECLKPLPIETHLVMSKSAEITLAYETELKVAQVQTLADVFHPVADIGASISSGSFNTLGMVIAPCSIRLHVGNSQRRHLDSADAGRRRRTQGTATAGADAA